MRIEKFSEGRRLSSHKGSSGVTLVQQNFLVKGFRVSPCTDQPHGSIDLHEQSTVHFEPHHTNKPTMLRDKQAGRILSKMSPAVTSGARH